jgi:HK97 family phage prohead protease
VNKRYAIGEVKDLGDAGDFPGEFEVILSTPELDRDGEVIEKGAFNPLPDHVSFDIDHGMSVATTVGSGAPRYDGDALKVKGTWSSIPMAQQVRTLVREGHVKYTSVAFMAPKYETKDGVPTITKAEILNGAFTPIPSNRGAAVLSAKSFGEEVGIRDFRPMFKGHGMAASELSAAISKAIEDVHGGERVYTSLRDYTDEYAIFYVYSYQTGDRLLKQSYEVTGNKATMSGDPIEVVAKVVYEPLSTEDTETRTAPTSETVEKTAPDAETVEALAQARLVVAQASATLALID